MAASTAADTPEIGQLVEVRGRHWTVTDVLPSALPPDVLGGEGARQHLLTLSSVEDDAMGEELQVIWEAEVGRRIRRQATLPEVVPHGFDHPWTLAAFLDAVRWGAVTSADRDTLQAPFRSGIDLDDYQLEPLVRALGQPRVNLLVADDVGLGKTIEAGLVTQELLLRHRARRVMVVCPATLTLKWQAEMAEKFGLDFTIVDSECLKQLRRTHGIDANPFKVYPLTIVSLSWLPGPRADRVLNEVLPASPTYPRAFDLLIVDEVHHVAPKAPKAHYAIDSQQTRVVRRLAQHFEHRLFLSATPHNGYRESWTALLAMLDPLRFARGVEPDRRAVAQVMVRRMKDQILNSDGSPRFPKRVVEAIEVDYSETDREAHSLLASLTEQRRRRVAQDRRRRAAVDIATLLLKKRLFSSPLAFARTIDHYAETLHRRSRREQADAEPVAAPAWLERLELLGEEAADDTAKTDAERDQLTRLSEHELTLTEGEDQLLGRLVAWAKRYGDVPDAKATKLLELLRGTCRPGPDGTWNQERVVVFTEYRDTQIWLADLLEARGLGGEHLRLLYGGMDEDLRERIKYAFQAPPDRDPVRILLATDCAGEGIDLQLQCHRVVNYDIPFNPNRLEQRIGRIDRHGQRHRPEAFHFVGAGWRSAAAGSFERDLEFLSRVAKKVSTQQQDLGEVNAVLEREIQNQMLGVGATVDPAQVTASPSARVLASERNLRERIEALSRRLRQSIADLHVEPANLERAARAALELARQPDLSQPLLDGWDPGLFRLPALSGTWARVLAGNADPLTGEARWVTFDPALAARREDVVLVHLGHPLLALSTRLLRAGIWGADRASLHRVSAMRGRGLRLESTLLLAFSRLVLVGADGVRLHEEVYPAGGWLRQGRLQSLGVLALADLADRVTSIDEPEPVTEAERERLVQEWRSASGPLRTAIESRARDREESLRGALERVRREESTRLRETVAQFRQTLERALHDSPMESAQLRLFDPSEQDQLRRDVTTWQATLAGLSDQEEAEQRQIARRYAEVRRLSFPAAVLFVVPEAARR